MKTKTLKSLFELSILFLDNCSFFWFDGIENIAQQNEWYKIVLNISSNFNIHLGICCVLAIVETVVLLLVWFSKLYKNRVEQVDGESRVYTCLLKRWKTNVGKIFFFLIPKEINVY